MLVLTRKMGEEIRIGDDIIVKITGIQGGRVRVGIDAPRSKSIVRAEVIELELAEKVTSRDDRTVAGSVIHASALH